MGNGTQNPTPPPGVPVWVPYAVQIISTLGISTLFAGVLLWFTLSRIDGTLVVIQNNEARRTELLISIEHAFIAALDAQSDRFDKAIQMNIEANTREFREMMGTFREMMGKPPAGPSVPPGGQ